MLEIVTLLLVLLLSETESRWTLEVRLHHYNNPTSQRSFGGCCDNDGNFMDNSCNDPCDNSFVFCLRPSLLSPGCSYGIYRTGLVTGGDDLIFTDGLIGENAVSNPLQFNGTQWPDNDLIAFVTTINDDDGGDDPSEFIELLGINLLYPTVTNVYSNETLRSRLIMITLQASFNMRCAQYFYGSQCDIFCQSHNDDTGHYTCDSQGNKLCNEDYQMNETNCTIPNLISSVASKTTAVSVSPSATTTAVSGVSPSVPVITSASSTSSTTINAVIGVVLGLSMIMAIAVLVIATLLFLHKRKTYLPRKDSGHTIPLDNPLYSSPATGTDGPPNEYGTNYYLVSENNSFERILNNPLYDQPVRNSVADAVSMENNFYSLASLTDDDGIDQSAIPHSTDIQYFELSDSQPSHLEHSGENPGED